MASSLSSSSRGSSRAKPGMVMSPVAEFVDVSQLKYQEKDAMIDTFKKWRCKVSSRRGGGREDDVSSHSQTAMEHKEKGRSVERGAMQRGGIEQQ